MKLILQVNITHSSDFCLASNSITCRCNREHYFSARRGRHFVVLNLEYKTFSGAALELVCGKWKQCRLEAAFTQIKSETGGTDIPASLYETAIGFSTAVAIN
jgi:hypothetical protein